MKILIVTNLYPPHLGGGAERSVSLLAEALQANGDEVVVVTLEKQSHETIEQRNGVKVYRLPIDNVYWLEESESPRTQFNRLHWHLRDIDNGRAAGRFGKILDRERPEVVHTNILAGFSASIWPEVTRRNICLVHTLRDYYLICERSSLFADNKNCEGACLSCRFFTSRRRQLASQVDAVVAISQHVLRRHLEADLFAGTPAEIILNSVEHQRTGPSQAATRSPLQAHQSTEGMQPLVFGYIGRLVPEKGVELLLKACAALRGGGWRLLLAGGGRPEYVSELQQQFRDPRIEWIGFTPSQQFFSQIDVCIVPSVWEEPLGRTVLEALSAGKLVLCSDQGGLPEAAALAKSVWLFSVTDKTALTTMLEQVLRDPALKGRGGYRDADTERTVEPTHVASRYRDVYSRAINYRSKDRATPA